MSQESPRVRRIQAQIELKLAEIAELKDILVRHRRHSMHGLSKAWLESALHTLGDGTHVEVMAPHVYEGNCNPKHMVRARTYQAGLQIDGLHDNNLFPDTDGDGAELYVEKATIEELQKMLDRKHAPCG